MNKQEYAAEARSLRSRLADVMRERDEARGQALGYIQRAKELAKELDEAQAEVKHLKAESRMEQEHTNNYIRFLHKAEAKLKDVAERQREACAKRVETLSGFMFAVTVRRTPLVTEVEK